MSLFHILFFLRCFFLISELLEISLLLPFPIFSYSPALLSPNSFLVSKKQWVKTEPNILANSWPPPWHSAHKRDWKDLPDCEMGGSREWSPWTSLYKSLYVVWIEGNKIMILGDWVLCWSSVAALDLYSYYAAQVAIFFSLLNDF